MNRNRTALEVALRTVLDRLTTWTSAAVAATAILATAPAVAAERLTLDFTGAEPAERMIVHYRCEGVGPLVVEYINAGPNRLALVPIAGDTLVFVTVVAGSGAKYVSGPYTWWTKGSSAELSDLFKGQEAEPVSCEEAN